MNALLDGHHADKVDEKQTKGQTIEWVKKWFPSQIKAIKIQYALIIDHAKYDDAGLISTNQ